MWERVSENSDAANEAKPRIESAGRGSKQMRRYLFVLMGLVCGLTTPLAGEDYVPTGEETTLDYPLDPPESYSFDSGVIGNGASLPATTNTHVIRMEGSHLIRVYFGETQLEQGSFIRMTSLLDGEVQELDAADLAMWHDASAYFNGDQVTVELVAGPKTVNNRFVIEVKPACRERRQLLDSRYMVTPEAT